LGGFLFLVGIFFVFFFLFLLLDLGVIRPCAAFNDALPGGMKNKWRMCEFILRVAVNLGHENRYPAFISGISR